MRHCIFSEDYQNTYKVCFLVPTINKEQIINEYLSCLDVPREDILVLDLYKDSSKKKTSAKDMKEYLEDVQVQLKQFNVEYVIIADPEYFKLFSGSKKADVSIGYVLPSPTGQYVSYVPNFKGIFYDPDKVRDKIKKSLKAVGDHIKGTYKEPGNNIIKNAWYPIEVDEIRKALDSLHAYEALTCDIETWGLNPTTCGLGSIAFAWNTHNGIAFKIDASVERKGTITRRLLKDFFMKYQGKLIFHNISFDVTVLIYQLFMDDITDTEGMLKGMEFLLKNFDDTKIIAYLATNSCAGNELGLKALSQEFAGNYAQEDIADISKIPTQQLLEYNLVDALSTWFVYLKYEPKIREDNQKDLYESLFKPALVDIIQMQLTGLPLNMKRVLEVKAQLTQDLNNALKTIRDSRIISKFTLMLNEKWVEAKNKKLKKKKVTIFDAHEEFNPRSNLQLKELLYEFLQLPIINYTDSHQPSTDGSTLEALIKHTENQEVIDLLQAFLDFSAVDKILTAFIPAFENAVYSPKINWHFLIGNFNLGGTVSGRLSSSNPNLQNLPSTGSKYAKTIKSCFSAPPGWLFCGLDFNALEAHIDALVTKDPAKLAVYISGYDSHMYNAVHYWPEKFPTYTDNDTEENIRDNLELLKKTNKAERQESKKITFALQYGGMENTLMKNCGFSKEEASSIVSNYKRLYWVSEKDKEDHIKQACSDGFVTGAFGLKVRTPVLKQCILGTKVTPKEAEAEKRTATNARFQSYGLLNNRAGVAFNRQVRSSKYRLEIKPVCHIHDAQYFLVKDSPETILWFNEHLVKEVEWQDEPQIRHDKVKLGGETSIFWPDWAHELVLPNKLSEPELIKLVTNYMGKL